MATVSSHQDPEGRWVATANDRFKARFDTYLARSTAAAVLLHAVLFLWSPEWRGTPVLGGGSAGGLHLEVLGLAPLADAGGAPAFVPMTGDETEDPAESDDEGRGEGSNPSPELAAAGSTGSADLRDRLGSLRPSLVEPAPEPSPRPAAVETPAEAEDRSAAREPEGSGQDGAGIRGAVAGLTYDELTEEELLQLERLSALRPELAFSAPSTWVLLRNPNQVGRFMHERFGSGQPGEWPRGTFSVAVWIDERGSVEWAEISHSSGHPTVDRSAIELFQDVVSFRPARESGLPVATAAIFWLSFW